MKKKKKSIEERREINRVELMEQQLTSLSWLTNKLAEYVISQNDCPDFVIYAAFAFLFVILLFTIYMIAELITPKNANYQIGNRDVVGQSNQTERGGETNIATITYDEQMQLGAYIGQLEGRLDKYTRERFRPTWPTTWITLTK